MVYTTARPPKRQRATRSGRTAKPARRSRVAGVLKSANAEYKALIQYLKAAIGELPKAECQLLMEFADIARQKCGRAGRTSRTCSRPATA